MRVKSLDTSEQSMPRKLAAEQSVDDDLLEILNSHNFNKYF
jgi:hypothetical protein